MRVIGQLFRGHFRPQAGRSCRLGFACLLAALFAFATAHGQTNWTGTTSTNWNTGTNWSSASVPTTGVNVVIDTNSGNQPAFGAGNATIANISIGDSGASGGNTLLTIEDGANLTGNFSSIGNLAGATGSVLVTGAGTTWISAGNIYVGKAGTGQLSISNGGSVTTNGTIFLGNFSGSNGTLSLGPGTLQVGGTNGIQSGSGTSALIMAGGILRIVERNFTSSTQATLSTGATSIIDTNGLNATLSGILSGAGSLMKSGTGTLTLSGANSYSGNTTISAGTLVYSGIISFLAGNIINNASLVISPTSNRTYSGVISGSGGLTKTNSVTTLTLSGVNTYTGETIIAGGGIVFKGDTSLLTGNVTNNGTLTFNQSIASNFSGSISGDGAVLVRSGNLTLFGNNTYTGNTTITFGILGLGNQFALQNSTLIYNAGSLQFGSVTSATIGGLSGNQEIVLENTLGGAVALTLGKNGVSTTFTGTLIGSGSLIKDGNGTLSLLGVNSYSGATIINNGTLVLSSLGNLGMSTPVYFNGGTLKYASSGVTESARMIILNAKGGVIDTSDKDVDFSNTLAISGEGGLTKIGNGTLTLAGNNSYEGSTEINGGALQFSNLNNLGINPVINFNGGTLRYAVGSIADVSVRNLNFNANGGYIDTNGNDVTFYNPINNSGLFGKSGNGTLTLTRADQNFTGQIVINGGTLVFDGLFARVASHANLTIGVVPFGDSPLSGNLAIIHGAQVASSYSKLGDAGVLVAGVGSQWTVSGNLAVGDRGASQLTIRDGGKVASATAFLGRLPYYSGSVLVMGSGSSFDISGPFYGQRGSLTIRDSGSVISGNTELGSAGANPTFTANVTGENSTWTVNGFLGLGEGRTGSSIGTASLTISNGGKVVNADAAIGEAMAVVSDPGSTWINIGNLSIYKTFGLANLTITNGATVSAINASMGNGSATIDGLGTSWIMAGSLTIAGDRSSTLTISNGAMVSDANVRLSTQGTFTSAVVTVTGIGSTWSTSGNFYVEGDVVGQTIANQPQLTISQGGSLYTKDAYFGSGLFTGGHTGSLTIIDSTSSWINQGNVSLAVPYDPHTTEFDFATIDQYGGLVQIGGSLILGPQAATYNLAAGRLQIGGTNGIIASGNYYQFNLAGGTLQINGTDLTTSANVGLVTGTNSTIDTNGLNAAWTGNFSGAGNLNKSGLGSLVLAGNSSYTGTMRVSAGTLSLTGTLAGLANLTVENDASISVSGTMATNRASFAPGSFINLIITDHDHFGRFNVNDLLDYGGNFTLNLGPSLRNGVYNLFVFESMANNFLNVALMGAFTGSMANSGGIWSTVFNNENFSFNITTGQLVASLDLPAGTSAARRTWLEDNFTALELADPLVSGNLAAPAGDGIPNLVKYAFDLDPFTSQNAALPQPAQSSGNIVLTFTALRSDIAYTVEASTDLTDWSSAGVNIQTSGSQVTASYPLPPPPGQAFLRIVVAPAAPPE